MKRVGRGFPTGYAEHDCLSVLGYRESGSQGVPRFSRHYPKPFHVPSNKSGPIGPGIGSRRPGLQKRTMQANTSARYCIPGPLNLGLYELPTGSAKGARQTKVDADRLPPACLVACQEPYLITMDLLLSQTKPACSSTWMIRTL